MEISVVCEKNLQYFCLSVFCFFFFVFYPGFSPLCLLSLTSAYNTSVGGGRWGNFNCMHVASVKKKTADDGHHGSSCTVKKRQRFVSLYWLSAQPPSVPPSHLLFAHLSCVFARVDNHKKCSCAFGLFVCSLLFMPVQNGEQCYRR